MFPMGNPSNLNRGQFSGSFGATNMPNTSANTGGKITNMPKKPGPTGQISGLNGKPSTMRGTIRSSFGKM